MSVRKNYRGWFGDPYRHALASKGIETTLDNNVGNKKSEEQNSSKLDDDEEKKFSDLKELRNWLVEELNVSPNEIYVYGSIARGDYKEHSDLDIIVNAMLKVEDEYPSDYSEWAKKYKVWYDGNWREVELTDSFGDHPKYHLEGESKEDAIRLDELIKKEGYV